MKLYLLSVFRKGGNEQQHSFSVSPVPQLVDNEAGSNDETRCRCCPQIRYVVNGIARPSEVIDLDNLQYASPTASPHATYIQ